LDKGKEGTKRKKFPRGVIENFVKRFVGSYRAADEVGGEATKALVRRQKGGGTRWVVLEGQRKSKETEV